jgi:hypothetical protein
MAKYGRRAERIIGKIDQRCRKAAESGKDYAVVMNILPSDRDVSVQVRGFSDLRGSAILVFQECVRRGLRPKLEYWYTVEPREQSGYYLVARW